MKSSSASCFSCLGKNSSCQKRRFLSARVLSAKVGAASRVQRSPTRTPSPVQDSPRGPTLGQIFGNEPIVVPATVYHVQVAPTKLPSLKQLRRSESLCLLQTSLHSYLTLNWYRLGKLQEFTIDQGYRSLKYKTFVRNETKCK